MSIQTFSGQQIQTIRSKLGDINVRTNEYVSPDYATYVVDLRLKRDGVDYQSVLAAVAARGTAPSVTITMTLFGIDEQRIGQNQLQTIENILNYSFTLLTLNKPEFGPYEKYIATIRTMDRFGGGENVVTEVHADSLEQLFDDLQRQIQRQMQRYSPARAPSMRPTRSVQKTRGQPSPRISPQYAGTTSQVRSPVGPPTLREQSPYEPVSRIFEESVEEISSPVGSPTKGTPAMEELFDIEEFTSPRMGRTSPSETRSQSEGLQIGRRQSFGGSSQKSPSMSQFLQQLEQGGKQKSGTRFGQSPASPGQRVEGFPVLQRTYSGGRSFARTYTNPDTSPTGGFPLQQQGSKTLRRSGGQSGNFSSTGDQQGFPIGASTPSSPPKRTGTEMRSPIGGFYSSTTDRNNTSRKKSANNSLFPF
jgi:hypothetical protein